MKTGANVISLKPFKDMRGTLKKIVMKSQLEEGSSIGEVYLLYTLENSVRGNHYHKETHEFFTVVSGKARVALKDIATGDYEELELLAESNQVLKVPPGVAHAFKNESSEPLVILAVSTKEYSKLDPDSFPFDIL